MLTRKRQNSDYAQSVVSSDTTSVIKVTVLTAFIGTINHTRVAGRTLGGGFGFLTGRHGLTIDNLLSARMVLSNGRVVTASETENPDLFWAIRGSELNFTIATTFTFRVHQVPLEVWHCELVFLASQRPQIVEFFNKAHTTFTEDAILIVVFGKESPGSVITCAGMYLGPEAEAKNLYGDLFDLNPLVQKTQMMPYEKCNTVMNDYMAYGEHKAMAGFAFKAPIDDALVTSFQERHAQSMETSRVKDVILLFELFLHSKVVQVPLDATDYANRGDYYNFGLLCELDDEEKDLIWKEFIQFMAQYKRQNGRVMQEKDVGVYAGKTYRLLTINQINHHYRPRRKGRRPSLRT
jgi:hypothetical protein